MSNPDVLIVGAGLSGLCSARLLCGQGVSCEILEASDDVGGRVRTDEVDGFLLDRGFQVLLTAYPEAQNVLNYEALELQKFEPGALIRFNGRFQRLVDPWRRPRYLLATATSPVASMTDKFRVMGLRRHLSSQSLAELYDRPEVSTLKRLQEDGFSESITERFFRPFLGGVFLEPELNTSSRKFEFVFRMFSAGDVVVPAGGMQAIPRQLAASLPPGTIRTNTPVAIARRDHVVLNNGEKKCANAVVVAADQTAANKVLGESGKTSWNEVLCVYFAAERPPIEESILVLNGEGRGPINNLCVLSQVASSYSPPGKALISVSVLHGLDQDEQKVVASVRQQLIDWFGSEAGQWEHLRNYRVHHALPQQPSLNPVEKPSLRDDGVFVCGDYLDTASIQGAMASGRRAAESVLNARQEWNEPAI